MSYFDKKVALVTGGASGIGYSIVKKLLENGIKGVGVVDISDEDGKKVEKELKYKYFDKILVIKADVTKNQELEDAFEKTISKFNNLDIIVNNAGIVNEVEWEKTIAVNLVAVIRGSYLAKDKYFPLHKSGEEGVIVNIASILGLFGMDHLLVYCATKHGVIGLSKSLAEQKCPSSHKFKIITICPGTIDTPLLSNRPVVLDFATFQRDIHRLSEKTTSPDFVGESVIQLIQKSKHGSAWIIENEEPPYEVKYPSKLDLRK
ncbi:15-hydroxyprostaglandin dehydrogenase [NAD(+)]-like [Anoplophora glabripennis]|uniref:15-hydroxyprostaglandin dehydrogenase [NAD(+)]-like n=1 Tax=Anoplophora glabripennis TaxID=217634 RepID=UPI0008744FCC|nr:15-hydroxyprostaglandin dehydrogenase [NAD(+)]-like [Anoplophora glabripennis]